MPSASLLTGVVPGHPVLRSGTHGQLVPLYRHQVVHGVHVRFHAGGEDRGDDVGDFRAVFGLTASTGCLFGVPCSPLPNTANRVFDGTSGAVPYGGAAAALARHWMRRFGQVDPGLVYARMIVAGQNPYPFDNTQGARRVKLPVNGPGGPRQKIGRHVTIDVPIYVTRATAHDLDGAIWWPESRTGQDDIDL